MGPAQEGHAGNAADAPAADKFEVSIQLGVLWGTGGKAKEADVR